MMVEVRIELDAKISHDHSNSQTDNKHAGAKEEE